MFITRVPVAQNSLVHQGRAEQIENSHDDRQANPARACVESPVARFPIPSAVSRGVQLGNAGAESRKPVNS